MAEHMELIFALASLTWGLVEVRNPPLWLGVDSDPLSEPPAKEDLKTNEVSEATSKNSRLLEELDVYPELPPHQENAIEDFFIRNQGTFGLNTTFGHLATKILIPLKGGIKETFVPPFEVSHVNYEVMDKQMSYWIQLIAIRSSKSFWAVLPLFNYWNKTL